MKYLTTLPRKLPRDGGVIVHNRVHARWADQAPGYDGFRAWVEPKRKLPKSAKLCGCGWSGLPHYRTDAKKGDPWHYGRPPNIRGKRMPARVRAFCVDVEASRARMLKRRSRE